jgi:DNA-binding NtrC family response regulator
MGDSEVRVLVVDDDQASLEAARTMLGFSGFEVRGANNGALGLEEVLTFRPDVVVFDFWMPVADGRELLQGIREVGRKPGLVAMSGTPEVEDWCGRVGVTQFLHKPFDRSSLVEAVRRALEDARATSSRSRPSSSMPASHRLRVDRAVMIVGPRESVTPVRNLLREGERPFQVAVVEQVADAIRALGSFKLDALAICGVEDDPMLAALVAEASVRGLPIVLGRAVDGAAAPRLHVAPQNHADSIVEIIHNVVSGPR